MHTKEASSPTCTVLSIPAVEVCSIWNGVWTCTPFSVIPYTAGTRRLIEDSKDDVKCMLHSVQPVFIEWGKKTAQVKVVNHVDT